MGTLEDPCLPLKPKSVGLGPPGPLDKNRSDDTRGTSWLDPPGPCVRLGPPKGRRIGVLNDGTPWGSPDSPKPLADPPPRAAACPEALSVDPVKPPRDGTLQPPERALRASGGGGIGISTGGSSLHDPGARRRGNSAQYPGPRVRLSPPDRRDGTAIDGTPGDLYLRFSPCARLGSPGPAGWDPRRRYPWGRMSPLSPCVRLGPLCEAGPRQWIFSLGQTDSGLGDVV